MAWSALVVLLTAIGSGCEKISLWLNPPDLGVETMADDTVWKERKSPYRITESFMIVSEATLTIEPGVEILLGPDVTINCYGRIVAEGTEEKPIRFRPLEGEPWDKIDCFGGKTSAEGKMLPDIFRHCIIEGGRGLKARDADVHVEFCKLRNMVDTPLSLEFSSGRILRNEIYDNTTKPEDTSGNGGGMVVYSDREVVVEDNDVHHNVSDGGRDGGGGIYAYAYDKGRVSILNNRIWRNRSDRYGGGLVAFECTVSGNLIVENVADDSGGGLFALGGRIEENRIEGNRAGRGGGLYAEGSLVRHNSVANNKASPFMGGGLFYYGDGRVEENTFYRNGSGGEEPGDAIVVSGGPVLRRNNIAASLGYSLRVQTHSLAPDLDGRENFWGTRDPEVVIARIYDWLDDAERGLVDWDDIAPRWIQEAPPPPPDFLTCQGEGEEWTLRWSYPLDVPVSGFRVHWAGEAGFPLSAGQSMDGQGRSVRLARPHPDVSFFCLSAFREGEKGEILESAVSRLIPVPASGAGSPPQPGTKTAGIRPVQPSRCDPPLEKVPLLKADPGIPEDSRARARWVISEMPVDFSTPLFDSGPVEGSDSFPLPEGLLQPGREYAWRVVFQGDDGNWTDWSSATRFCTPPREPDVLQGPVRENRVLGEKKGTTYRVTGNVFVPKGIALEILPGTRMEIAPGVNFRVRGTWVARGEKARPIVFTGDPESPWGHLFFDGEEELEGQSSGQDERGGEKAVLEHCTIEHGRGVLVEEAGSLLKDCVIRNNHASGISIRNASARIENNRIVDNRSPSNGGGIYAYGSKLIYILDNEILSNEAGEDGGGVFGYGYRSNTAVNLSGNRIEGNRSGGDGGGVWLSRSAMVDNRILSNQAEGKGGGMFATFALVKDNEVAGNSAEEGGGVYAETNSSLEGNRITDNRCEGDFGGGVYMNFWGMSIKNEVFRGNLVKGNRAATPTDNGGIYLNGSMIFEHNQIFRNQGSQLYNANPSDRPPLTAPNCYWGTARPEEIEAAIHHAADDPALARVLFKPFAATPEKTVIPAKAGTP
jgi:hypothetical protein